MSEAGALLFDMDGVVIDSNPLHRDAWTQYNLRNGIATTDEMRLRISGKRNDEVVRDFFGSHLTDEAVTAHGRNKEVLYRTLMGSRLAAAIVPGIENFIARHPALRTALVTNAEPANVSFVLDGAGLRGRFQTVVSGEDLRRPKPFPDIYLRAAELLHIDAGKCVVFEDSPTGVSAGLAAGMKVVGVSTSAPWLEGVSLMISDFNDPALEEWLDVTVYSSDPLHVGREERRSVEP